MFKKIGIVTALSTALLFGGAFQSTADASANADQSNVNSYKVFYSVSGNWGNLSENNINEAVNKYMNKFQIDWNDFGWNKAEAEQKEQPKKEEVKQPVQKEETPAKEEQPEQKEETPAKKEQPVQKEETPVKEEQPVQKEEQPAKQPEAPVQQPTKEQEQQNQNQAQNQQLSQYEQEVVELTNQERAKHGLSALEIDTNLSKVAREKSNDMAANNYFAHNSPTYGSPFDMMKQFGISYSTAGENIAKGQRTPEEVVNAWMNSEGHRANILNGNFTHIGVGFVEQGNHWTQQFIGK
ncbi:hypothetical protein CIL05_18490 [Virgibacillus profundi]|uniref:SCP domain-containing protein n=1 Tax=Virgibacillus profundi TaxID=2024555 RepID=A0A2A2IA55_9BACI|nr:CAP domain-containing protein [Virgibacillus profundi]PAV28164.1 hypothetical protein CIL05_18490 [Virgibacillus profundi]PXY52469.1 hypothetical protein CIT14_17940 [Virgibacillus profundi]